MLPFPNPNHWRFRIFPAVLDNGEQPRALGGASEEALPEPAGWKECKYLPAAAPSSHLPIPILPSMPPLRRQIWWGHMLLGHTMSMSMSRPNLDPLTLWVVSALSGRSFWSKRR